MPWTALGGLAPSPTRAKSSAAILRLRTAAPLAQRAGAQRKGRSFSGGGLAVFFHRSEKSRAKRGPLAPIGKNTLKPDMLRSQRAAPIDEKGRLGSLQEPVLLALDGRRFTGQFDKQHQRRDAPSSEIVHHGLIVQPFSS